MGTEHKASDENELCDDMSNDDNRKQSEATGTAGQVEQQVKLQSIKCPLLWKG